MNSKQFDLFKNVKYIKKRKLTYDDFLKNKSYMEEVNLLNDEYAEKLKNIEKKYTINQIILNDSYKEYLNAYSDYAHLILMGFVMCFSSIFIYFYHPNNGINFNIVSLMILFLSIIIIIRGIRGYFIYKRYKKLNN